MVLRQHTRVGFGGGSIIETIVHGLMTAGRGSAAEDFGALTFELLFGRTSTLTTKRHRGSAGVDAQLLFFFVLLVLVVVVVVLVAVV